LEKVEIRHAGPADIAAVRAMMREYIEWIALDLAFQEIDAELDGLPGDYAPPRGVLLVAVDGERYAGMIALRPFDDRICEMKRLFIRPEARGLGLARRLIDALLDEARRLGYEEIRLDTLPMMGAAQALYEAMGFVDMPAYYETPIAGTRFMRKAL
jgi:ribosomal protein S18 acetylase RimI-like enzyme